MTTTPYDKCCCSACGPPWHDTTPQPDPGTIHALPWHSWMALCPTCGNKRCPSAANHHNECTGSNEPGQPGSNYPAIDPQAPRQTVDELRRRLGLTP